MSWETKLFIIDIVFLIPLLIYMWEDGTKRHNSHGQDEYCPRCRPMTYF